MEYFKSFDYINSGEMTFNDDLVIENQVFRLLDNELTKESKKKLRLEEIILDKYLEKKQVYFFKKNLFLIYVIAITNKIIRRFYYGRSTCSSKKY